MTLHTIKPDCTNCLEDVEDLHIASDQFMTCSEACKNALEQRLADNQNTVRYRIVDGTYAVLQRYRERLLYAGIKGLRYGGRF